MSQSFNTSSTWEENAGRAGEEFLFTPDCMLSWSYLKFTLINVLIPNSESILFLQERDFCKSQGPLALQAVKQNQACKMLSAEAIFCRMLSVASCQDSCPATIPGILPETVYIQVGFQKTVRKLHMRCEFGRWGEITVKVIFVFCSLYRGS